MSNIHESRPQRRILLIDSYPEHVAAVERTLHESAISCEVVAIASGAEAVDFLYRRGNYSDAPRPDLMLMDWQLADLSGRDMLETIKADTTLRRIPVIVFSMCDRSPDILESYTLHGNCYVVKSSDLDELTSTIRRIEEFWLGVVTLPTE